MTALRVLVDGTSLPDGEARTLWKRFSDWMEEHPGDLGGFAAAEGLASVHPTMQGGSPVLVASRTAPQRPYSSAATGGGEPDGARGGTRPSRPPRAARSARPKTTPKKPQPK